MNGEKTEDQIFLDFLKNFDSPNDPDGQVLVLFLLWKPNCCTHVYFCSMLLKCDFVSFKHFDNHCACVLAWSG